VQEAEGDRFVDIAADGFDAVIRPQGVTHTPKQIHLDRDGGKPIGATARACA
jgi:hypothetical protein